MAGPEELDRRTFTDADQRWFADVSGDQNPLHTDPLLARRLLAGEQVVHGMHLVLWMLDQLLTGAERSLGRIDATFAKPVFLHEELVLMKSASSLGAHLRAERHGTPLVEVRVTWADLPPARRTAATARVFGTEQHPKELPFTALEGRSGTQPVREDGGDLDEAFPSASQRLGSAVLAELAAVSALVGMECPGLHSILAGVSLSREPSDDEGGLRWSVLRTDLRVGGVRLEVAGSELRGVVQAFFRPEPTDQPAALELAAHVDRAEFRGVRALVVGGSRGLGELTAKFVAAGGGEVVLTWHQGRSEALKVVEDIRAAGGEAMGRQLDVAAPEQSVADLVRSDFEPTHVLYFASPRIFTRRTRRFDEALLETFIRSYVTGFVRTVEACLDEGIGDLVAFYPSSVAVTEDHGELVEYAAAKAAGEVAANSLASTKRGVRVVVERLPRLPTDQTASLLAVTGGDAVAILGPIIRRVIAA